MEQKAIIFRCRTDIRDELAMMLFDGLFVEYDETYELETLT